MVEMAHSQALSLFSLRTRLQTQYTHVYACTRATLAANIHCTVALFTISQPLRVIKPFRLTPALDLVTNQVIH